MAHATKELKIKVQRLIQEYCKQHNIKLRFSMAIRHHTELRVNIQACSIDLVGNCIETMEARLKDKANPLPLGAKREQFEHVDLKFNKERRKSFNEFQSLKFNEYNLTNYFSGQALELMKAVYDALKVEYFNESDISTDYHNVAYYYSFHIGNSKLGFTHYLA